MHLGWCNFISFLRLGDSFLRTGYSSPVKNYIHGTIYCAVEIRPQEIVFSQLTPPIGKAKVTSLARRFPSGRSEAIREFQLVGIARQSSPDVPANRSRCYAQPGVISGRREGRFSRLGVDYSDPLG